VLFDSKPPEELEVRDLLRNPRVRVGLGLTVTLLMVAIGLISGLAGGRDAVRTGEQKIHENSRKFAKKSRKITKKIRKITKF